MKFENQSDCQTLLKKQKLIAMNILTSLDSSFHNNPYQTENSKWKVAWNDKQKL